MVILALFSHRCGATQSGNLDSSNEEALDGILGFGKSNTSMISQLASSRQVKKMFAHCLDGINGGGIFDIGHVVQPKVNLTPLVPNRGFLCNEILGSLEEKILGKFSRKHQKDEMNGSFTMYFLMIIPEYDL
ncbi:hypothetical protein GOBAR_DD01491 [Gossypium barbadense]|nr:hypothetical protein GOBAR_DD01491 [Gossypium barbadense]